MFNRSVLVVLVDTKISFRKIQTKYIKLNKTPEMKG